MVSVIILSLNEERDLPGCLESLGWCDDVHLVDSGSRDGTCELARGRGVNVLVHPFESFGAQRNWALDHCPVRHDWVLFLDADERTPPEMVGKMQAAVQKATAEVAGFYCCWKLMLHARWLKHSDNFPKWQFRLLRRGRARFTDFGHGQKEGRVDGRLEYLPEPYLHLAFSRGWEDWEARHRKYARQEAAARRTGKFSWRALLSRHASQRNPAIKLLVGGIPGWPGLRFFYTYILRGGFLEGREGYLYCRKMMWYEQLIQSELRRPPPSHAHETA